MYCDITRIVWNSIKDEERTVIVIDSIETKLLISKDLFKYKIAQYMVGDHSSHVIIWVYQYTRTSGRINKDNKHNTSWTL